MTSPRAWTEVRVTVPDGWGELVASVFAAAPFGGVAFGPSSLATPPAPEGSDYLRAYVPNGLDDGDLRARVRTDLDALAATTGAEELAAMDIAIADPRVAQRLKLGETPQAAMHYWSQKNTDLSHNRRSAAVLFGQPGARASLVVVVDLLDGIVGEIVPAEQW